ncbi:HEPN domain-containing protein [Streptomyces sp. SID11233]|nr:HEPN domain-containing protein [Streptomyces sp. SID11385]NED88466.1 HEPN domain-containing protein [Streptomyces sp. SID11233]
MALERRSDALALHHAGRHVACLYHLGFTAECLAKALCVAYGKKVPKGRDGHNIPVIVASAGFRLTGLSDETLAFLADRDVSLRYQATLAQDIHIETQIKAAAEFVKWCTRYLRPQSERRAARAQRKDGA